MALGIGTTIAMFTLIQGVLLRPLPVQDQGRLIVAWTKLRSGTFDHWPFHVDDIEAMGRESRLFERVAGVSFQGAGTDVAVEHGEASYIRTASVTGTFFAVLGVAPVLGRALEPADDVAGAEKVLVITHGLWQRRYGGARDVIGRRLMLSEHPFTIVGVMPSGLDYPRGVEGWTTVEAHAMGIFADAVRQENDMVGRLRPGVTRAQAIAELGGLVDRLEVARRRNARELSPVVRSFEEVVVGDVRPAMLILFAAVALVLLIASANVANLLLLRGEARRTELAVRAALGASRGRIAAQLLAESLLLAVASAAVGLAASRWVLQGSLALVPGGLPRVESVRIDGAVVLFTAAVAFLAAGLAGLAPALYATHTDLVAELRTGRQYGTAGARHGRRALAGAQVSLAVAVVAASGLLTRSLLRLQHVELGLSAERVVVVALSIPPPKDGDRARYVRFHDAVVAQLEGIPGVEKATPINNPPLAGINGWDSPQSMTEGQTPDEAESNPSLSLESIYPSHFATLGVPIVRGREFTEADGEGAPEVAIVSADVAARLWPGEDPIGKRLRMGNPTTNEPWQTWRTVVGVVNPIRYRELVVARATLYLPARQFIESAGALLLRTALPPEALAAGVRERVRAVDPTVRVMAVVPFRQFLEGPLARPRFHAFVIGLFGASALLLAVVGLYSVMAAYVRQRYPEIGIRVALGATASDVRRLVLGEGLRLAGLGAAIGLAGAVAGARVLRGLLFGVHPLDPVSLLGAVVLLVSASALACSLPAWRATRVDPAVVLRTS